MGIGLPLALRGPSHSFSAPTQFLLSLLFPILTGGRVSVERTTCVKLRLFNAIPWASTNLAKSFRNNTYRILPAKSLRMNTYTKKGWGCMHRPALALGATSLEDCRRVART